MVEPTSETYRLLYCDDLGEVIGLDEVQLLEPHPSERIEPLRAMLTGGEVTASFHSLLILVAWGDPIGLEAARYFLSASENQAAGVSIHRLHGRDLAYDELADALALALDNPGVGSATIAPLAIQLLTLFRTEYLASGLERLLSSLADQQLEDELISAIQDVKAQGRIREAADLLPALATTNPGLAWQLLESFSDPDGYPQEAITGIAFTLGRIETSEASEQLQQLRHSDLPGAAIAAEIALRRR